MMNRLTIPVFLILAFTLFLIASFKPPFSDLDYGIYDFYFYNYNYLEVKGIAVLQYLSYIAEEYDLGISIIFVFYAGLALLLKSAVFLSQRDTALALLVYYALTFFVLHEFTQIRIALAISIVYFFYMLSFHKSSKYFYFGLFLAYFIHASVVYFLVPLAFFNYVRNHRYILFLFFASFLFAQLIYVLNLGDLMMSMISGFNFYKMEDYSVLREQDLHTKMNTLNILYLTYFALGFILIKYKHYVSTCFSGFFIRNFIFGVMTFYCFSFFPVAAFRLSEMLISGLAFVLVYLSRNMSWLPFAGFFILLYALSIFLLNVFYNGLIVF